MSTWRNLLKRLHALGGEAKAADLEVQLPGERHAMARLKAMGMVENNGRRGIGCVWRITPLGVAWCEGRVVDIRVRSETRAERYGLQPVGVALVEVEAV